MALPKIQHQLHEHYLTGLKKTVKFRKFINKEQKILLQAKQETEDMKETSSEARRIILNAVTQLLENCIHTKVDVSKLSTFDIEDIFLRLRSKSVGEQFNVKYRENYTDEEGKPKTHFIDININLDDIKVVTDTEHKSLIRISDKIAIQMRYPTFDMLAKCEDSNQLSKACIDLIIDGNDVHNADDSSPQELDEFYEDLEPSVMMDIKRFFDTMPKLQHKVKVTLHDGVEKELLFEGLQSFFG